MKIKKPLIIAEIGVNHFDIAKLFDISPIDAAKKMIYEAKINGADVAKFQTYKAEKMLEGEFILKRMFQRVI